MRMGPAPSQTDHLVNRLDDLEHFVVANLPVAIDIIQLESPVEFVLHFSAARNA